MVGKDAEERKPEAMRQGQQRRAPTHCLWGTQWEGGQWVERGGHPLGGLVDIHRRDGGGQHQGSGCEARATGTGKKDTEEAESTS